MLTKIESDRQYEETLAHIYFLIQENQKEESEQSDELEVLSLLVKEYENNYYPVPKANPIEIGKFRNEQMGVSDC